MMLPRFLYKYQPFTVQTLANLKDRQIWFAKPISFNDPFECGIRIDTAPIPEGSLDPLFLQFRKEAPDPQACDAKYLESGKVNDLFKEHVMRAVSQSFTERKRIMRQERGVCCFAESNDDILMWSHYAQGHSGLCLEFDTSFEPFRRARRVIYRKEIPSVNPASVLLDDSDELLMSMITTKFDCWSYEREWRLFHIEGDKPFVYPVGALTGIYFGSSMDFAHKEILSLILQGSPTKLYEAVRSESEFRVTTRPVTYIPYNYNYSGT